MRESFENPTIRPGELTGHTRCWARTIYARPFVSVSLSNVGVRNSTAIRHMRPRSTRVKITSSSSSLIFHEERSRAAPQASTFQLAIARCKRGPRARGEFWEEARRARLIIREAAIRLLVCIDRRFLWERARRALSDNAIGGERFC